MTRHVTESWATAVAVHNVAMCGRYTEMHLVRIHALYGLTNPTIPISGLERYAARLNRPGFVGGSNS